MAAITRKNGLTELIAIAAAVVGLVLYVVTSTTGYLAGRALDPLPVVLTVVGVLLLAADLGLRNRLAAVVRDLLLLAAVAALVGSFALFLLARVPLAADVHFIPVNYPAAEETTLNVSLVGMAFYLVAIVAGIVEAFVARRAEPAVIRVAAA
jgi:hypothetical protein